MFFALTNSKEAMSPKVVHKW